MYGLYDMVGRMKTTVNLPDPLLEMAREAARRDGVTFKELLELSLQREIERRARQARAPFRLREFSVEGEGVRSEVREGDWFDLVYPASGSAPAADR